MRNTLVLGLLFAFLAAVAFGQSSNSRFPKAGAVPDEATAIKIAEAVLLPVYGEDLINKERPLHARYDKGIWTVYGTLPPHTLGGTVMVRMRKKDGKILEIFHSV